VAEVKRLRVQDRDVVRISSAQLQLDLLPTLGGTVVSLQFLPKQVELLWRTPWAGRHPEAGSLPGSAENVMFDSYLGGWQTIFPNGGDSVIVDGAEWGFDGEARSVRFDEHTAGSSLIMETRLARSPFVLTKIVSLSDDEVTIGETVKNVGSEHSDVMWGQQVSLGAPMLGPDTIIDTAATLVRPDPRCTPEVSYDDILPWPRSYGTNGMINLRSVPASDNGGVTRWAYLSDFRAPSASVTNPRLGLRVDLTWDLDVWPYVWFQLETGGRTSYPWYGSGYFLSLTPSTSWPAHGIHEARRVSASSLRIYPGVARTSHLSVRVTQTS
jgi:hypothetical protein